MDEDIKLPEPVAWIAEYGGDVYTADQLRAIEQAATAPLLARIAELEAKLAEAQKDTARLDYVATGKVTVSRDNGGFQLAWYDHNSQKLKWQNSWHETARAAIDAALQAENERLREQLRLATVDQATAEAEASDAHAEIERLRAERDVLREALKELIFWIPTGDTYRRLGLDPKAPMRALENARAALTARTSPQSCAERSLDLKHCLRPRQSGQTRLSAPTEKPCTNPWNAT